MTAGLPGTGIGGLFYLLLVLLMPLTELLRLFRGRSSIERWRCIGLHWAIAAGIVGSLGAAAAGLRVLLDLIGHLAPQPQVWSQVVIDVTTVPAIAALGVAAGVLVVVLGLAAALSLFHGRGTQPPHG